MIVFGGEEGVGLVRQREHARLSRVMADRAQVDSEPLVRRAIRHHDDGWEDYDEIPRFDADGGLIDYRSVPLPDHLEILSRSVEQCRKIDPYAGWLVSRHGCSFHENKSGEPVETFLRTQENLRAELEEGFERTQGDRTRDFDWLQFADALSLFALDPWSETWSWERRTPGNVTVERTDRHRYRYEGAGFDPGTHRFPFRYRTIPEASTASTPRVRANYESAEPEEGTIVLNVRE